MQGNEEHSKDCSEGSQCYVLGISVLWTAESERGCIALSLSAAFNTVPLRVKLLLTSNLGKGMRLAENKDNLGTNSQHMSALYFGSQTVCSAVCQ